MLFRRFLYLTIVVLSGVLELNAQKSYQVHTVAFYNLENLFDTINDPDKEDEKSPIMDMAPATRPAVYKDKLSKLSRVLSELGTEKTKTAPSIIGVVEIENRQVLEDLISHDSLVAFNYGIIHHDSPDKRGIDTGLLYKKNHFKPTHHEAIPVKIYNEDKRVFTRDILWVSGFLDDEKVHFLVNHWPSRRGGEKRSSRLREKAAWTCLETIKKIREEEPNAKIFGMGDFNDNPNNKSFKKVLKTEQNIRKVTKGDLYNPFEKMFKNGYNTLTFRGELHLFDQIFFTDNAIAKNKDYSAFKYFKSGIHNPNYMTLQSGRYKGSPKRSFAGASYLGGYSDHYPVYIYLIRELKE